MLRTAFGRAVWMGASLGVLLAGPARAQDPRVEIGVIAGWTFSDGVTFHAVLAGDGNVYNSIEPKDAFSYSLNLGFFVTANMEVGGLFSQQKSKLQVGGTTAREIGDQSVDNYHGYFAYNSGDSDARRASTSSAGWGHPVRQRALHGRERLRRHRGQHASSPPPGGPD